MSTSNDADKLPHVGSRLALGGSHATVRYVGPIQSTKGLWLGVEWDEAGRGKHDGEHGSIIYFTCRQKGAGSFIRPSDKIELGVSFLMALRDKYVGDDDQLKEVVPVSQKFSRKNLAEIEIETPNMEGVRKRMAQLDRLKVVGLDAWKVERKLDKSAASGPLACALDESEEPGAILSTCPSIEWLDISRSLLPSWKEVARIAQELPRLSTLIAHFNRFDLLTSLEGISDQAFSKIRDLRLDRTLISWAEIQILSARLPMLESLQLAANGYAKLESKGICESLARLEILNLDRNRITDWKDLMETLQECPRLERLLLSNNPLTCVSTPPSNNQQHSSIRHVSLLNAPLSQWSDLENLFLWLPKLNSIVISRETCPFLTSLAEGDVRTCLLARLPKMCSLNHVDITDRERNDAELFYITLVQRQAASSDDIDRIHPQYTRLAKKHGKATDFTPASSSTNTLKSKLLPIRIHASTSTPRSLPPFSTPPSWQQPHCGPVEIKLLVSTPLRLLIPKIAKSLKAPDGARSIVAIWALLGQEIDPGLLTAIQLRSDLRPNERLDRSSERIVFQLDNLDWSLCDYNFSLGDELFVVVVEE